MKSLRGKLQFSGSWDEDLNTSIEIFETMAKMCDVKDAQLLQASFPLILPEDALSYFSQTFEECSSYEVQISELKKWYNA